MKRAEYEARLAEKRYRSVDPENRLVAAQLEKGWEAALRSLAEAREATERFERTPLVPELEPTVRAGLKDLDVCCVVCKVKRGPSEFPIQRSFRWPNPSLPHRWPSCKKP